MKFQSQTCGTGLEVVQRKNSYHSHVSFFLAISNPPIMEFKKLAFPFGDKLILCLCIISSEERSKIMALQSSILL